ncbi:PilX N-terminal domain-containing pilus assembly protein [Shewanella maritima]|uniref:pilus assembly PilX family protein n=1 Tax=Shewanella maritima TaxID=2520507 RepID=UPI003736F7E2
MKQKQQGIVLFFTLIILVIMTVIGVALAVNSTQSLRMASAGSERVEAKAIADGAISAILLDKPQSYFALLNTQGSESFSGGTQTLTPMPFVDDGAGGMISDPQIVSCKRSEDASGGNSIKCRNTQISSEINFGRNGLGQLTVVSGISQELLSGS